MFSMMTIGIEKEKILNHSQTLHVCVHNDAAVIMVRSETVWSLILCHNGHWCNFMQFSANIISSYACPHWRMNASTMNILRYDSVVMNYHISGFVRYDVGKTIEGSVTVHRHIKLVFLVRDALSLKDTPKVGYGHAWLNVLIGSKRTLTVREYGNELGLGDLIGSGCSRIVIMYQSKNFVVRIHGP